MQMERKEFALFNYESHEVLSRHPAHLRSQARDRQFMNSRGTRLGKARNYPPWHRLELWALYIPCNWNKKIWFCFFVTTLLSDGNGIHKYHRPSAHSYFNPDPTVSSKQARKQRAGITHQTSPPPSISRTGRVNAQCRPKSLEGLVANKLLFLQGEGGGFINILCIVYLSNSSMKPTVAALEHLCCTTTFNPQ